MLSIFFKYLCLVININSRKCINYRLFYSMNCVDTKLQTKLQVSECIYPLSLHEFLKDSKT
jgi:hypothetical protein